jgi:hypothetical protein
MASMWYKWYLVPCNELSLELLSEAWTFPGRVMLAANRVWSRVGNTCGLDRMAPPRQEPASPNALPTFPLRTGLLQIVF